MFRIKIPNPECFDKIKDLIPKTIGVDVSTGELLIDVDNFEEEKYLYNKVQDIFRNNDCDFLITGERNAY